MIQLMLCPPALESERPVQPRLVSSPSVTREDQLGDSGTMEGRHVPLR